MSNNATNHRNLSLWLEYLAKRGRTQRTIEAYGSAVRSILSMCEMTHRRLDLSNLTEEDIYYIKDTIPVKEQVAQYYLRALGSLAQWLTGSNPIRDEHILWNKPSIHRNFITAAQFFSVLDVADPAQRMVLLLGAMLGLRRREMCRLTLEDIGPGFIRVMGKGHGKGKEVEMHTSPELGEELRRYLVWRSTRVPATNRDFLVMESWGKRVTSGADCYTKIGNDLRILGNRLGFPLSAHCLRRLFCMTAYEGGADLLTLQEMMRHCSPDTTMQCYLRADPSAVNSGIDSVSRILLAGH